MSAGRVSSGARPSRTTMSASLRPPASRPGTTIPKRERASSRDRTAASRALCGGKLSQAITSASRRRHVRLPRLTMPWLRSELRTAEARPARCASRLMWPRQMYGLLDRPLHQQGCSEMRGTGRLSFLGQEVLLESCRSARTPTITNEGIEKFCSRRPNVPTNTHKVRSSRMGF